MGLDHSITSVVDVGARYGKHPSWNGFGGDLLYLAFEPDGEEAERLQAKNNQPGFEVIQLALAKEEGARDFYITKHRGYCSFYEPDLESMWFKKYRPGEGEIEAVIQIKTQSLDYFASQRGIKVDFLKIDTEASELEILQGAKHQLANNVLGVRCEFHFQVCYKNQPLFPDIFNYLVEQQFFLLNMDYFGRGVPAIQLFRNPNPFVPDTQRYGLLMGADGVFLKDYDLICRSCNSQDKNELAYITLKYAYFCLLNNAVDVGLQTLLIFKREKQGEFSQVLKESQLYKSLRKSCIEYLGQYRVNSESSDWQLAQSISKDVFDLVLEPGNKYWELLDNL